jgi:hypothetical protein
MDLKYKLVGSNFEDIKWDEVFIDEEVFIKGTHIGNFRAYGPHQVKSIEERILINSEGVEFPQPEECLLILINNFTPHEKSYVNFMLDNHDIDEWSKFTGLCVLVGIKQNRKIKDILVYIFETYHNLNLKEMSIDKDVLDEDMNIYFNNRYNK